MARLIFLPLLVSALVLTACAPSPRPAPVAPSPAPVARPSVPATHHPLPGWEAAPLTRGNWLYRPDADTPAALFGPSSSPALLVLRCVRTDGQILLQRATNAPPGSGGALQVQTTSRSLALKANVPFTGPVYLTAAVSATDPLWDAIAFSRGRWRLGGSGADDLILPRAAELGRIVEDCRTGAGRNDSDRK